MSALPTRRDEAWRYADHAALARVRSELAPAEAIVVPAGERAARTIGALPASGIVQLDIMIGAGGRFDLACLCAGAGYGRIELAVTLAQGAHFELGGVILGKDEDTLEIVTTVTHAEPDATSRQTVRSVLTGRATGSYLGKVAVARGAQGTDSVQDVKAMLLTRTATANAKPELEIYADDVKCAHGCAVGELDAAALFYLAQRGLPPAEAKRLLLEAFVAGVFEGTDTALGEAALAKLGGMV